MTLAPAPFAGQLNSTWKTLFPRKFSRGGFKGKDLIKITVKDEGENNKHLFFESVKTESPSGVKQLAQTSSDAT